MIFLYMLVPLSAVNLVAVRVYGGSSSSATLTLSQRFFRFLLSIHSCFYFWFNAFF